MEKRLMMLFTYLMIGVGLVTAQNRKASGVVLSEEDGLPIIGATVLVQGTSVGTITDIDGNFSITNIPSEAKNLEFSYIGMKSQALPIKPQMEVSLISDTKVLDEVMVVAFGKAKKSAFTGSAATVKSEKITSRQTSNVTNALSGQVAGVQTTSSNGQPGESAKVRIRGIGSISASNTPLYVIDGVPFEGEMSSLNTQDIESMTVLKDAASNALYGARGANGVILITTRKGKLGKPVINVDAKWGSNRRGVPNYDVIKNPGTYYEMAYSAIYNDLIRNNTPENAHAKANSTLLTSKEGGVGYLVYTLPDGEKLIGVDGKLNSNATLGYSDGDYTYRPDDWFDEIFDKGNLRQEYNINISGATDKINYFMSAGYLDDKGIIPNSGFERFSTRLKADYQMYEWLKVGANMSYVSSKSTYPRDQSGSSSGNIFYVGNLIAPIYPLYVRDAEGQIMKDRRGFTIYDYGDKTSTNFTRSFMGMSNPASAIELDKRVYQTDFFSGKWFANISLMPNLVFSTNIGTDITNQKMNMRLNPYYGQFAEQGGVLSAQSYRIATLNRQFLLTYNFDIDLHSFDFLVGYEAYNMKSEGLYGSKSNVYNPDVIELDNAINDPNTSGSIDKYNTAGYLARAQYNYDNKYFASVSFRRDGSSRFHPDNRWGNFWSIGGGWLMNQENFLSDVKWINMLKFKMSYGVQGNDDLLFVDGRSNYYPYMDQFRLTNLSGNHAISFDYKGNKDITWETSHSFNTGFDYELLNNRLTGSIEYFSRKTTDMLYYKPTPLSYGYAQVPMNIGSMINRGLELDVNGVLYDSRKITWDMNFNLTFFKNKVLKLEKSLGGELIDGSRIYREGESLYQMYLREYAGVDEATGKALYYKDVKDENGKIMKETTDDWSNATRYATGDILPKVYGGFGSSLKVYDFDFSVSFAYQLGGKIYDNTYAALMHGGAASNAGTNWHKDALKSWTPENTNTSVPQINRGHLYSNNLSDRFITSSNYLSLQNITLGYNVPKTLLKKLQVSALRLYVVADNVALFSKRKGLDPRQGYMSSGNDVYSPMRTISGGINISF
ncbi:TonB-dependent receptor [Bacteroides sp.]|uniref:SusC/RagA family TonB-linked outer membrane protein n=1 Tax=Bacteroides sp. TaxID=29523 RepID=UPI002589DFBD|nr:TonB-dependent receptor [Bacteroides sp.]